MKKIYRVAMIIMLPVHLSGQTGGTATYTFLGLPATARIAALGGKMVAVKDGDLNLSFSNPSLLTKEMEYQLVLNMADYFAGISYGYASFALPSGTWGNRAVGIQFINYGRFTEADETGVITGQFRASEYAFHLMWSKDIDSLLTIGITLKPVFSVFERYTSLGLATDLGATYHRPENGFTASLVIRNLGTQLFTYHGITEPLPLEIMLGASYKPEHAPFRFIFLLHHMERYTLTYQTEAENSVNAGSSPTDNPSGLEKAAENLMRHLIAGVEFMPLDNLYLRLGYNYQRRRELQVPTRIGTVGLSWGFGLKISHFSIAYGRATYHLAGASNHFTVTTRLNDLFSL
ncbi:MAG: type IX secretion system protein PorQ [Bacteroidales bacterium]